ncbi:MAG: glycoside hydrolase family 3 C-terminal domain-containing protein [Mogibacterium sp.]|nr:glycoside hydrolase family 3 C-terminal domain-containing protein [Mogibacterium sp.]
MELYEKKHIETLRSLLPECTVLLKKNGAFPLERPCRIGAFGSGVRFTVKGGTGSGEVNSRYFVNIEEALWKAGFDVVGGGWSGLYGYYYDKAKKEYYDSIRQKARDEKMNLISASMGAVMKAPEHDIRLDFDCDAAIYVVSRISGEGNDRLPEKGDFKLTDSEVNDILALDAAYDKFMLVLNTGGPVDLSPVMEVGNILVLSQLGVETGSALADILLGKTYPSGKLATTWTMFEDYSTAGDFGLRDDTRYREGIYVGYRYFDAFGVEPLFPFGYGLGYTDFEVSSDAVMVGKSVVDVSAVVKNTGGFKGKETVQVYISCPAGELDREVKSLAGFAKTDELEPGSEQRVNVTFDIRDFAAFDQKSGTWILEKGKYIILVGTSSENIVPAAYIYLDKTVTVRKAYGKFGETDFADIKMIGERQFETDGLLTLKFHKNNLTDERPEGKVFTDDVPSLGEFTEEELALLNVGTFNAGGIMQSVIGDSASSVAGAAGESSGAFADRGVSGIVMADGPAGIRISREYYEDEKGKHSVGGLPIPESMKDMMPKPVRMILDRKHVKKGVEIKTQYCTAIPIATAIAQSFNVELAEKLGDIVGSEMELFGIDLWLAPALNIHRSVLCGRNFEYYSEDPVVSGLIAAAVTRGVQKHPGCGVTLKHFAANNQETNRYANNSVISERALREIYLKGFGIAIRESDPMALMTSYNLLNGEHTSESYALTTDVLRREFGFDGLVMTDWVIGGDLLLAGGSKYGTPDPAKVAAAGCSLFMPGRKNDKEAILKGLENGTVTYDQLRENTRWLVHVAGRLGK